MKITTIIVRVLCTYYTSIIVGMGCCVLELIGGYWGNCCCWDWLLLVKDNDEDECVAMSSIFKWVMNRSRSWRTGRRHLIFASTSVLTISPVNIYFIWYNKSQNTSIYTSGVSRGVDLSTFSSSSYKAIVKRQTIAGFSPLNLCRKGATKWQTKRSWTSFVKIGNILSVTRLKNYKYI